MKIAKLNPYDPYSFNAPQKPKDPTKELRHKFEDAMDFARHEDLLTQTEYEDLAEKIKEAIESSKAFWDYEEKVGAIESNQEYWEWKQELEGHLSRLESIINQLKERGTPLDVGSIMSELERLGFVNAEDFPELYDQAIQKVKAYVASE